MLITKCKHANRLHYDGAHPNKHISNNHFGFLFTRLYWTHVFFFHNSLPSGSCKSRMCCVQASFCKTDSHKRPDLSKFIRIYDHPQLTCHPPVQWGGRLQMQAASPAWCVWCRMHLHLTINTCDSNKFLSKAVVYLTAFLRKLISTFWFESIKTVPLFLLTHYELGLSSAQGSKLNHNCLSSHHSQNYSKITKTEKEGKKVCAVLKPCKTSRLISKHCSAQLNILICPEQQLGYLCVTQHFDVKCSDIHLICWGNAGEVMRFM